MIQTAIDYASELHKTGMSHEELSSVKDIFEVVPQVKEELSDPTVSLEKKHLVIQKVFSKNVRNFLQLLCDNDDISLFDEVCKALKELEMTPEQKESTAVLTYVEAPSDEQLAGIKSFIAKEFRNQNIRLEMVQDASLKSGFVLKVGSKEYDWSEKARIEQLKSSIAKAVNILEKYGVEYALMHTTNLYPTDPALVRLGAMQELMREFPDVPVGLSDHTLNNNACIAAMALGAKLVERHFTDYMEEKMRTLMEQSHIIVDDLDAFVESYHGPVEKLYVTFPNRAEYEKAYEAVRKLPVFLTDGGWAVDLEVMSRDTDKGVALRALAEKLGIAREQVLAMGDSGNDCAMLRYAGVGAAMGNAGEQAKKAADVIAPSNREDGVAWMLRRAARGEV